MGPKALTKPQNYTQTLNSRYAMFRENCLSNKSEMTQQKV